MGDNPALSDSGAREAEDIGSNARGIRGKRDASARDYPDVLKIDRAVY